MGTCLDYAKELGRWPNCIVPDCPAKACLHLNSRKCWPHTVGVPLDWSKGMSDEEAEAKSEEIEDAFLCASASPR